ncbi:Hypothetical predicted protein [Paramuricea clavata]|uniref:Uncharacterized protein n=1 Tax=Paramuricea clavata TaxID=317549 RepID=A0A6S7FN76_PARCT|nr:Hypothetical predicted protein [Paramuricea clavata]
MSHTPTNPEILETVTKPTPPQKVKDPRRVAAGKRLAAISQQAKANKKARLEAEASIEREDDEEKTSMFSMERICTVFGLGIGLGSLYLAWRSSHEKDEEEESSAKDFSKDEVSVEKSPERVPFDDLFD